jgi:hypothetical protein
MFASGVYAFSPSPLKTVDEADEYLKEWARDFLRVSGRK